MLHGDELLQLLQAVDILDLIDKLHTGRERERGREAVPPLWLLKTPLEVSLEASERCRTNGSFALVTPG